MDLISVISACGLVVGLLVITYRAKASTAGQSAAYCRVGDPAYENGKGGLSLRRFEDGHVAPATIRSERVRFTRPHLSQWFLYFVVAPDLASVIASRGAAFVVITYMIGKESGEDALAIGASVVLEYERGERCHYRVTAPAVFATEWRRVAFLLEAPGFSQRQPLGVASSRAGADFRVSLEIGTRKGALIVRDVTLAAAN